MHVLMYACARACMHDQSGIRRQLPGPACGRMGVNECMCMCVLQAWRPACGRMGGERMKPKAIDMHARAPGNGAAPRVHGGHVLVIDREIDCRLR